MKNVRIANLSDWFQPETGLINTAFNCDGTFGEKSTGMGEMIVTIDNSPPWRQPGKNLLQDSKPRVAQKTNQMIDLRTLRKLLFHPFKRRG
jgi:hypothetical protein